MKHLFYLVNQVLYPDDNYCIDCGATITKDEWLCERCRLLEQNGDIRLHEEL